MGLRLVRALLGAAISGALASSSASCSPFSASGDPAAEDGGGGGPDAEGGTPVGPCTLSASPTTLAVAATTPSKVVINGEHVYWLESGVRIMRISLTDCTTREVATGNITALASGSDYLVWGDPVIRTLKHSDVGIATATSGAAMPDPSMIIAGTTFWVDAANGQVTECAVPCVSTSVAARVEMPRLLAANAAKIFFFGIDPQGGANTNLWWRANSASAGSQIMGPLATQQDEKLLAASSSRVFWVTQDGSAYSVATNGGTSTDLGQVTGAGALVADDSFVYVANANGIRRANADGKMFDTTVASNEARPVSIALTASQIVWANGDDRAIRRMKKP